MITHIGTQPIETERLLLRRFTLNDAEMMFNNWANDAEVTRYLRWIPHQSVEESRQILAGFVEGYASPRSYLWGICLKSGELIGSIGADVVSDNDGVADMGYCVGRAFWGNGYVAEATRAVITYMLARVGLNRVEAYHALANPASGRVMQKAGMTYEGTAREKYRNHFGAHDSALYGITKTDWETQNEIAHYNALPVVFDGFAELPALTDGEIELCCTEKKPAIPEKKWVPGYAFEIRKDGARIGTIDLRIGYVESLYYGGQIGYSVDEAHRGHGYAGAACRLLIPVMRAHGMQKVLITNDQHNTASRRVCEKLGTRLIRLARLPEWHDLYQRGQRFSNIFEWTL